MKTPARTFSLAFGAVYVLVGLIGFAVTGFDNWFASDSGEFLLWFELNPLHNVVHLVIGAALLFGATRPGLARMTAAVVGGAYLAVGIIGFFATGQAWNILSLNVWDNWLHIGTAVLALLAVSAESRGRTATTTTTTSSARERQREMTNA
ncbi:MAG: DUF4383 domain-containing protein [Nitriliruptorales bacterium]|nr:DUF4383 domain-containing protein [Nitriliruptorales bacterium]